MKGCWGPGFDSDILHLTGQHHFLGILFWDSNLSEVLKAVAIISLT